MCVLYCITVQEECATASLTLSDAAQDTEDSKQSEDGSNWIQYTTVCMY